MKYESELYHHGILGQKWGNRNGPPYPLSSSDHSTSEKKAGWKKSLNSTGNDSLSDKEKKKVSKKYEKASKKVNKEINRKDSQMSLDVYNRTANDLNSHKIYEFNEDQKTKYGDNYGRREGYEHDYMEMYNETLTKNYNEVLLEFYDNSKNYKKAEDFSKKYDMESWNELAKNNSDTIKELKKVVEEEKKK